MMKNWIGNKKSIYTTLGASNHVVGERAEDDYYATDPQAIRDLFEVEKFYNDIWECACGEGHLSKVIEEEYPNDVYASDLVFRGYGDGGLDFLKEDIDWQGDIITNPPYKYALEFAQRGVEVINKGTHRPRKLALFMKLTFLEGQKRKKFFRKNPPARIYVYSHRIKCAKNGKFTGIKSSAACYAWFVWVADIRQEPRIYWI